MSHSVTPATVHLDEQTRHIMVGLGHHGQQPPTTGLGHHGQPPTTGLVQFAHVKDACNSP